MSDPTSDKVLKEVLRAAPRAFWWRKCPDERQLAAYVDVELDSELRSRIESHLARCSRCSATVGLVVKVQDTSQGTVVPPSLLKKARALGSAARKPQPSKWRWAPLTAAACLTVALVAYLRVPESTLQFRTESVPEQVVPGGTDANPPPAVSRVPESPVRTDSRTVRNTPSGAQGLEMMSPREGARVSASNLELRWTRVASALFYEVQLLGAEGALLWQQRVDGVTVRLPANVSLDHDASHFVLVRAHLADGRILKSRAIEFIPMATK